MIKNIDSKATQTGFGELVGVSQQAISKHFETGLLKKGQNYRAWLINYCEKLREEAAGRGSDEQGALTRARTKQATADANIKELNFQKEVGNLIPVEELEPLLDSWVTVVRSEFQYSIEKMIVAIESKNNIKIEQELIDETISSALKSVGNYPQNFAGDACQDGAQIYTSEETSNA